MASITTQNVSAAVASVVQPSPSAQVRSPNLGLQPGQLAQASQIAAQQQTHLAKRKDDDRSTQVPKRAEGSFNSQRNSAHSKSQPKVKDEGQSESQSRQHLGMNVVA
ncbi:MAG: hypothetical protein J0M12_01910 [Deltaproteobacteria bacterium]|nr:hypothetical protein [Deltaproteobacteria bacterium]